MNVQRDIKANIDVLHKCADLLIEKEKITREEFEALFEKLRRKPAVVCDICIEAQITTGISYKNRFEKNKIL